MRPSGWGSRLLITGLLVLAMPPVGGVQAVAAPGIAFGTPTISGIQGWGFEQDVRVDRTGRTYTSAPGTIAAAVSFAYRSLDGGQTFKLLPAAIQPQGKLALTCPAGGGDTELATDSVGNLYLADLYAANFAAARSADQGRTFVSSCASVPTTPDDRQWYAVDGNPLAGGSITLAYNVPPNITPLPNPPCTDNLLVFARSPVLLPANAGLEFGPAQPLNQPCDGNEGIMGNDEVFTYGSTTKAFVIHDNDALNQIRMGRCDLVPFTASPTGYANCIDAPVADLSGYRTGANFPTLAIDRAGNLFAVWEQAPYERISGRVTGDTLLKYSWSTDQGKTWATPQVLPTPGLFTNVFAWPAAGDAGRVDVAFYGTAAHQSCPPCQGPDSTTGDWGLYLMQSLSFTSASPAWSATVLASEHAIHRGSMFTLIGNQTGDRTLGDFLQLRAGTQGEGVISYSDSTSIAQLHAGGPSSSQGVSQGMVVRQSGGPSLLASVGTVRGIGPRLNSVQVGDHSATLDSAGLSSSDQPNLKILGSQVALKDPNTYQVKMLVADLRSLAPKADIVPFGTTLVWDTQWKVPSSTDPNGGAFFHTYMESTGGGAATFWVGQDAVQANPTGLQLTYPGLSSVSGSYTATAPGVITIDVPKSAVAEPGAINNLLYSVTAATMTLAGPAEITPTSSTGVGGLLFDLVDVAPAYDFDPALPTPPFQTCHEADGDGTVSGRTSGSAHFHFDRDACEGDGFPESVDEQDAGSGTDFHSTSIAAATFDDIAHTVTIVGDGTNAGRPVSFTMVGVDNSLVPGVFSLVLSDGYAVTGTVLGGSIQLT
jgi:hypothetical protein